MADSSSHGSRRGERPGPGATGLALGVTTLITVGCSDATTHSDCGSVFGGDTSMVTWWRAVVTAEGQAQQALVDGYASCSGGQVTVEPAADNKDDALRSYEDQDKHLLLVNGLSDIDRLQCTADRGSGLFALHDLDSFRWNDRIPKVLDPYVRPCHGADTGRLFAVPVGMHSLNRTLINKDYAATFARDDLTPESFLDTLAKLAAGGMTRPIAVPSNIEPSFLLVENIMVAVAGERYRDFWNMNRHTNSRDEIDMSPFVATMDFADKLLPYIEFVQGDDSDPNLLTMTKVCNGEAALTVMADWVDPNNYCDSLVSAPFPGTSQYDVFAFDAFAVDYSTALAASSEDAAAGYLPEQAPEYSWLKAVTSAEVQARYAELKRSRVLTKKDSSGNTVARSEDELFGPNVTPLPGLLLVVEHSTFEDFRDFLGAYLNTPPTDTTALEERKAAVVNYVHTELCVATDCEPTETTR